MLQHVSEEEKHLDILCLRLFTVELDYCIYFKAILYYKIPSIWTPRHLRFDLFFIFKAHSNVLDLCMLSCHLLSVGNEA